MREKLTAALIAFAAATGGCAPFFQKGYVPDTGIEAANYTEDYIHEFELETSGGKSLNIGGAQVKEFSKGGTFGNVCCAALPGVDQDIKIVWKTGGYNDPESKWVTHSAVTKIRGETIRKDEINIFMIVRFFQNDQVEAEYISQSIKFGTQLNPRVDPLFRGQRITRQLGE